MSKPEIRFVILIFLSHSGIVILIIRVDSRDSRVIFAVLPMQNRLL